jgi:hypothetical protein
VGAGQGGVEDARRVDAERLVPAAWRRRCLLLAVRRAQTVRTGTCIATAKRPPGRFSRFFCRTGGRESDLGGCVRPAERYSWRVWRADGTRQVGWVLNHPARPAVGGKEGERAAGCAEEQRKVGRERWEEERRSRGGKEPAHRRRREDVAPRAGEGGAGGSSSAGRRRIHPRARRPPEAMPCSAPPCSRRRPSELRLAVVEWSPPPRDPV